MVAAHEDARHNLIEFADGLLAMVGNTNPDAQAMGAAMTLAEFVQRVNHFLTKG